MIKSGSIRHTHMPHPQYSLLRFDGFKITDLYLSRNEEGESSFHPSIMGRLTERVIFGKEEESYCQTSEILPMVLMAFSGGFSSINQTCPKQFPERPGVSSSSSLTGSLGLFLIVTFCEAATQGKTKYTSTF